MTCMLRRRLLTSLAGTLGGAAVLGAGASGLLPGPLRAGMAQAQTAGRPAQPELRIGALFPASGPLGLIGDESFRGLELAVEARNEAGGVLGRPLRLVKADATDALQAAEGARRLMTTERVTAIFGTAASPLSFAATQQADLQGLPYFELGAIADQITRRGFRQLFRSAPTGRDVAEMTLAVHRELLPALWQKPASAIRLAILHEDGLYGQSVAEAQEAGLKQAGLLQAPGFLGRFGYAPGGGASGGGELGGLVQRLRVAGAELLLHTGHDQEIILLFRAMQDAGWRPRMVVGAGAGYSMIDTAQALRPALDGVMTVDVPPYASPGRCGADGRVLAEAYRAKYGHDPRSGHSLANHAGARIFLEALHRAGPLDRGPTDRGSTDRDRIRTAVLSTDLEAKDAPFGWGAAFDETGQNRRARPVLSQWQGGRLVAVFPGGAALAPPRGEMG